MPCVIGLLAPLSSEAMCVYRMVLKLSFESECGTVDMLGLLAIPFIGQVLHKDALISVWSKGTGNGMARRKRPKV